MREIWIAVLPVADQVDEDEEEVEVAGEEAEVAQEAEVVQEVVAQEEMVREAEMIAYCKRMAREAVVLEVAAEVMVLVEAAADIAGTDATSPDTSSTF